MNSIAVIGGGSWATALIKILSNSAINIEWWVRNEETVAFIRKYHHNPNYLSDVEVEINKVNVSSNLKEVISKSDCVILAIPAAFLSVALNVVTADDFKNKHIK